MSLKLYAIRTWNFVDDYYANKKARKKAKQLSVRAKRKIKKCLMDNLQNYKE